jgi:hypothetical protein
MALGCIRAGGKMDAVGRGLLRVLAKEELRYLKRRARRYNKEHRKDVEVYD